MAPIFDLEGNITPREGRKMHLLPCRWSWSQTRSGSAFAHHPVPGRDTQEELSPIIFYDKFWKMDIWLFFSVPLKRPRKVVKNTYCFRDNIKIYFFKFRKFNFILTTILYICKSSLLTLTMVGIVYFFKTILLSRRWPLSLWEHVIGIGDHCL